MPHAENPGARHRQITCLAPEPGVQVHRDPVEFGNHRATIGVMATMSIHAPGTSSMACARSSLQHYSSGRTLLAVDGRDPAASEAIRG